MNTNQKIAAAVGVAAVGALVAAYLYRRNDGPEEENVNTNRSSAKSEKKEADEGYQKAQALKQDGNTAFKEERYQDAVRLYTEALSHTNIDRHLLYSNRSAAYITMKLYQEALDDGMKCIEINPKWPKGYFRVGKALISLERFDEAFTYFYKGLQIDPKSDELKKHIELVKDQLGTPELDTRTTVDTQITKYYFNKMVEQLCSEVLFVSPATIRQIAVDTPFEERETLVQNDIIKECLAKDAEATYRVLILMLLDEKNALAQYLAKEALAQFPESPEIQFLYTAASLRVQQENPLELFENLKKAFTGHKDNILIAQTYVMLLMRLNGSGLLDNKYKTTDILADLVPLLDNPHFSHLLVADCGIRYWFQMLQDPILQNELMMEEQQNFSSHRSPNEAYLHGVANGAFRKLLLEPFFLHSLSLVPFNNPTIEKLLLPFRAALSHLPTENEDIFRKLEPLIYALGLQMHYVQYSWEHGPEDAETVRSFTHRVEETLASGASHLVNNGEITDRALLIKVAVLALFVPLSTIDGVEELVLAMDLSKVHPYLSSLLTKTVLNPRKERQIIEEELKAITPINQSGNYTFYDSHRSAIWQNAGIQSGRLVQVPILKEFEWLFPRYELKGFDSSRNVRTLIAGCGSGLEVYQYHTMYSDVDLTGVDMSANNVAYAIRQNRDLGFTDAKFYQADINKLDVDSFPEKTTFDLVVAHLVLSHLPDPLEGWSKLAKLVRKGGLMKVSLLSEQHITYLAAARNFIKSRYPVALFDNSTPLPRVIRTPSTEDILAIRQLLFAIEEQHEWLELLLTTAAFALNEFTDLIFSPQVFGFTHKAISECLKRLNLKFIGFEFPGIPQEALLMYRVEHPHDPYLQDVAAIEEFEKKHPGALRTPIVSPSYITLHCEKL